MTLQNPVLEAKGQARYIGTDSSEERKADCTSLMLQTAEVDTIDTEDVLNTMYNALLPDVDKLKEYINNYQLSAKFVIVINLSENPVMGLSKNFIHLASELNAEVEFDSYIDL